eukprot:CAMPEP_0194297892 /NCGR_PEP_ID=MMETSP0169-20130528/59862_1 /TAXON_ID=218684 /ORGANISM="Corethron pennatum, Strain L29A3" /LENGTH=101 /DNA_ID=CAMNT_0039047817 /DNA_START=567 /DNA_END=872 /DNA_ORIENTATION=-
MVPANQRIRTHTLGKLPYILLCALLVFVLQNSEHGPAIRSVSAQADGPRKDTPPVIIDDDEDFNDDDDEEDESEDEDFDDDDFDDDDFDDDDDVFDAGDEF